MKNQLKEQLISDLIIIIKRVKEEYEGEITGETLLINGGVDLDSMELILLISEIEENFSIELGLDILFNDNFDNLNKLTETLIINNEKGVSKYYNL